MEFDDSDYYTCPPLTDDAVRAAEANLGRKLPESYLRLVRTKNGGMPKRSCFPTPYRTSWARDHIAIRAILGIGGDSGIDSELLGSHNLIREWGYPNVGVVICDTPSGGHDTVMLDYTVEGDEPAVVYVDEDRVARPLAPSFEAFLSGLVDCDAFDLDVD